MNCPKVSQHEDDALTFWKQFWTDVIASFYFSSSKVKTLYATQSYVCPSYKYYLHDSCLDRVFDRNNDGFLSSNELRDVLQNLGDKMTGEDINEMMLLADQNGDGKIDYEGDIYIYT